MTVLASVVHVFLHQSQSNYQFYVKLVQQSLRTNKIRFFLLVPMSVYFQIKVTNIKGNNTHKIQFDKVLNFDGKSRQILTCIYLLLTEHKCNLPCVLTILCTLPCFKHHN